MRLTSTAMDAARSFALRLRGVGLLRDGNLVLDGVDLSVSHDQRWLVLGANGSGKTSLLRIAALYEHPTFGQVEVLGETLGSTDVRELRRRVGYLSASLASSLRPQLEAIEAVMTAKHAALEPWWHHYDDVDRQRALDCLERMGVAGLQSREIGSLSSGELQRVLLARTLMNEPGIILLDEPSARLDLGGREQLVGALRDLAGDPLAPPIVLVAHDLADVPPGMTHVLMLRYGRILASGPIDDCLTSDLLTDCFGMPLRLERTANGRYGAWSEG